MLALHWPDIVCYLEKRIIQTFYQNRAAGYLIEAEWRMYASIN